jgi:general secretion pathway protein L
MLNQIFTWWLRQMIALVPARLRKAARAPDALIVAVDRLEPDGAMAGPPSGTIFIRRAGTETFASSLRQPGAPIAAAGRLQTMLRLPEGAVLTREVSLPLAAERDLYHVLGFEMDRLTPFQPDEIFWGVTGVTRDPGRRLRMNLLITPRAPVETLLTALARLNLKPAFLEAQGGRIALGGTGPNAGRRLRITLYGLCVMLALACALIPLIRQQMAIADAQARIAQLRPAAQEAVGLRGRLSIVASGNNAIAAAAQAGDTLQMLAALTNALPDGTFLTDFTLKSGELTIDGQSSDAARLISLLSAAPAFHNPIFIAPVTRAINGQADLFSIRATVSP